MIPAVFGLVGIICILYFPVLCLDSRRWNPTFAAFWPAAGICFLAAGFLVCLDSRALVPILGILFVCLIIFGIVEIKILRCFHSRIPKGLDYLIVLGARVNGDRPSMALLNRIRSAEAYLSENEQTVAIVSGGQGPGEDLTEGKAMAERLISMGVSKERIFLEERSTSTEENLRFSAEFLDMERDSVGIVTNNFHVYRSIQLAKELGYKKVFGIPAYSKPVSLPNYLVREFFAVIKEWIVQKTRRNKDE